MRRLQPGCCYLLVLLLLPTLSFGQEFKQHNLAETDEVQKLNQEISDLQNQGNYGDAVPLQQKVIDIYLGELGEDHPDSAFEIGYLGALLIDAGDYATAQPHVERCLKLRRKLTPDSPDIGKSLRHMALIAENLDKPKQAIRYYEEAIAAFKRAYEQPHADTGQVLLELGLTLQYQEDYEQAEAINKQAIEVYQAALGADDPQTLVAMNNLASVYIDSGNYTAARRWCFDTLNARRRVLGNDDLDTAQSLWNVAVLLSLQEDYIQARDYRQQALRIYVDQYGENHEETADAYLEVGLDSQNMGDFRAAAEFYQRALSAYFQTLGEEDPATLQAMNNLSSALIDLGRYAEAREQIEATLVVRKRTLGNDHPDVAESLSNLGNVLSYQGKFAESSRQHQEALRIYRENYGLESSEAASELLALGYNAQSIADYVSARDFYQQSLDIYLKVLGEEDAETLRVMNNLATVQMDTGEYEAALQLVQKTLRIRGKSLGEDHPDYAESLVNLAWIEKQMGDATSARQRIEQALALEKEYWGEDRLEPAATAVNLAWLHMDQGNYDAALPLFQYAYQTRRKLLGDKHIDTASSLADLASIHSYQNDFAQARPFVEEALEIARGTVGEQHPTTLGFLSDYAKILDDLREFEKAREVTQQVLESRRKLLAEDHPDIADSLWDMAWIHLNDGEVEQARAALDQALGIYRKKLGEKNSGTISLQHEAGLLEAHAGNWKSALEKLDAARRQDHEVSAQLLSAMSPSEQLKLLALDDYMHIGVTLGVVRREDPAAVATTASWLINSKGISQESLAARELLARDLGDPAASEMAKQLLEVRRKLARLVVAAPSGSGTQFRQQQIESLSREEQELSRQLGTRIGQAVHSGNWVELNEIQQKLAKDEVLVNIVRYKPFDFAAQRKSLNQRWSAHHFAAYIVPPVGAGNVQIVDLGPAAEIEPLIQSIRSSIGTAAQSDGALRQEGEAAAERKLRRELKKLADKVWQPVADRLPKQTEKLVLSPDGSLWLLPWNALPLDDEKFLVEKFAVRLVTSGRELAEPRKETQSGKPVVFADPEFDLSPQDAQQATKTVLPESEISEDSVRGVVSQTALNKVPRLPSTRLEALAISPSVEAICGEAPTRYLAEFALESVVKQVKSPRVLVLSTHGFFLPDQQRESREETGSRSSSLMSAGGKPVENPLLRCGLLLAGCNQPAASSNDGVLTGMEIVGLDLRGTELVVLSACETGIGKVQSGEGVAGLRQAFQLAGAEGVVATLWQVPDRDSAILMQEFFKELADGKSQDEALRQAQIARIEARRRRYGAAHPFFWAAFTLTGK